ncbi:MAG: methyltransferase domain-containing protein, partial [Candidatus Acidiferrum sp.]
MQVQYTKEYYECIRSGSLRSAEVIAPLVLEALDVSSIVDVGCGDGTWLSVFRRLGVEDALGIDGEYVGDEFLQIPKELFRPIDLRKPFKIERCFDLAVCLEVAEHLPAECAPSLVESLAQLAPMVLFSAAIPFQGGLDHVNEQWPDRWAALFGAHGYLPIDFLRKRIWQNETVEMWYV